MNLHARIAATCLGILSSCSMGPIHSVFMGLTHVTYVSNGNGTPTVVFEAGMGDGLRSWESVFDSVSATTATVAYSRPGYSGGFYKKEADGKRTADDVARLLKQLLETEAVRPPYVLVGHSVGGMYVLRYAQLFPDEVAGIVLVDGRPKEFRKKCEAANFDLCSPPGVVGLLLEDHVKEELNGLEENEMEMPEPEELGNIPVTVITASEPPAYAPGALQELWLQVQQGFAERLRNGRFVKAEGAGHYIHKDKPDLVIMEIRALIERSRNRI